MANFVQDWGYAVGSQLTVHTLPITGATANNLLVAISGGSTARTFISASAGWNTVYADTGSGFCFVVLWKIAEGNSNDDLTITWSAGVRVSMLASEFTGTTTDAPIEASAENQSLASGGPWQSINTNQATSISADGIFIALNTTQGSAGWTKDGASIDSGFTNFSKAALDESNRPFSGIASKPFAGAGSSENPTFSTTDAGDRLYAALLVAKGTGGAQPKTEEMYIKDGGVFKQATPNIRVSGAWQEADAYIKDSGVWKQVHEK